MTILEIKNITKSYNGAEALKNINLNIKDGEILSLLGPSGCGKTTLLRVIAGLEIQDCGQVIFKGKDLSSVSPHKRNFGMMFQDFALFPHRNVFDNVSFGLEIKRESASFIKNRVMEMLSLVGLEAFAKRNVGDLSGGERQRVALARSIAPNPKLLMLDEPLGSLDRNLRERLIFDIRKILKTVGVTAVFVTHDQSEAFAVADQVAVISGGEVIQFDPPEALYKKPHNIKVAEFLGFNNLITGTVTNDNKVKSLIATFPIKNYTIKEGQDVTILLRPESARIVNSPDNSKREETIITGFVSGVIYKGYTYNVSFTTNSGELLSFDTGNVILPPAIGETINIAVPNSEITILY